MEVMQYLKISCYKKLSKILIRELLGFAAKHERFLKLDNVTDKAQKTETANVVTFTEEILNGKLNFLCIEKS